MSFASSALNPDRHRGRAYLRLVLLGAAIGIPAALLATLFLAVVHWLEHLLWTDIPARLGLDAPPWYLLVGLPVVGALIVALARWLLPGDGGHTPLDGIGGGETPVRYAPGIALAAIGTLAFGAVLGPEAPLIALGSVVGMAIVPLVKLDKQGENVLATAGSFSAVSALFGGPLVAGVLLLEGGLAAGAALLPALLPGLAAAAVGYVLFVGVGGWAGLSAASLAVPDLPTYDTTRILDLVLAIVVGVVASLMMTVVKRAARTLDRIATADKRVGFVMLPVAGLAVGVLALVGQWLGVDYEQILFSGQTGIPHTLAETSIVVLLVIIATKAIAYAICLGAGFRGGPVFPAIFLGVAVAMVAALLFGSSVTWALAVGAAAGMTAGTGMVFSALLFAGLLAGTPGLDALPAAVLAVLAAWLTNAALTVRAPTQPEPAEQA
ncbi:MAG: chloride channel protein [Propionicimonas sp.]|nr:chloride channel protein [Propionicimonas sp.]